MRVLFLTQSGLLKPFYGIYSHLKRDYGLSGAAFYVAGRRSFDSFRTEQPDFPSQNVELLKEWEIYERALAKGYDPKLLRELDQRLGEPTLWNAALADRRIILGKKATFSQDYAPRFGRDEMLALVQHTALALEDLVERFQPDLVAGFICVTLGEYLGWRVAASRGIPYLNLRPTRVENYIYAAEDPLEPSALLEEAFRRIRQDLAAHDTAPAERVLAQARGEQVLYEGVVKPSSKPPETMLKKLETRRGPLARWSGRLKTISDYFGTYRHDNHEPPLAPAWLYRNLVKPWRARRMQKTLSSGYQGPEELKGQDYVFFPLHTEPEVTLLVYSKPFLNQIEVIRLLALSLPINMKLVVKEHPWSVGKRPLSYYRKLLEIPGVVLAPPQALVRDLVLGSKLVAVISGSAGLEALMLKKPVITLGRAPFNFMPDSMLRRVADLDRLGHEMKDLLQNHRHDEEALLAFITAVMQNSTPVDFYSRLLGRQGVHTVGRGELDSEQERERHLERLAAYVVERMEVVKKQAASCEPRSS